MLCIRDCTATIVLLCIIAVASPTSTPAQTAPSTPAQTAPAAAPASKMKLTGQKLRAMRAKWKSNKPKLKACRAEVRKKGLIGDDRWFFIEDCMDKS
jgi:hypothetical protein